MGELRKRDHWLEHQEADPGTPEHWVIYQQDACGKILPSCIHTDDIAVAVEPETGRLIIALGTHLISCSSAVSASVVAAIATSTETGLTVANATEVARLVEAKGRAQQEVTDQLDSIIEQKRNELAELETKIAEATRGDLRQP